MATLKCSQKRALNTKKHEGIIAKNFSTEPNVAAHSQ